MQGVVAGTRVLARETWWRGSGVGVPRSPPGGSIHDLGDGLYLSSDRAVGEMFARTRAGPTGTPQLHELQLGRGGFGKVLDLTKDVRWAAYMKAPIVAGHTRESLIRYANENYGRYFEMFVAEHKIDLKQFDAIIGPEYVHGGRQVNIRNPKVAAAFQARMAQVEMTAPAPAEPAAGPRTTPPAGVGGRSRIWAGRAANAGAIAFQLVLAYLGSRLQKEEERNIKNGWKAVVAPKIEKKLERIEADWAANPASYPKTKTYLAIFYSLSFDIESSWILGKVPLYKETNYIGSFMTTTKTDKRLFPANRFPWMEQEDPPPHQVFVSSIVIADPEGDRKAAERAEREALESRITGEPGQREYHLPGGGRIPEY